MEQHGSPHSEADWLHPSAALALFEPGAGGVHAPAQRLREHAAYRYGFQVGELRLLIDPGTGSEVLARPRASPLPGTPPGFLGLMNLRGNLVPLYDLRVLLGVSTDAAQPGKMALVLGKGDLAVGIMIESYPSTLAALRPLAEMPSLPEALLGHVSAAYAEDGKPWLEFEHDSFFDQACGAGR